jgi:hypothetical protein
LATTPQSDFKVETGCHQEKGAKSAIRSRFDSIGTVPAASSAAWRGSRYCGFGLE